MSPKSRLLIVEAVLPAQTEAGGDIGGYLIDVSDLVSSSYLHSNFLSGWIDFDSERETLGSLLQLSC